MERIEVTTRAHQGLYSITAEVQAVIDHSGITDGLCFLFCPHSTAGLTINEGQDPSVRYDICLVLDDLARQRPDFQHAEGNSPSHAKASLIGSDLTLFVSCGKLVLGSWQGIFLAEFDGPRHRQVMVKVVAA